MALNGYQELTKNFNIGPIIPGRVLANKPFTIELKVKGNVSGPVRGSHRVRESSNKATIDTVFGPLIDCFD